MRTPFEEIMAEKTSSCIRSPTEPALDLSEGIVKSAFENLNWPALKLHLDSTAFDEDALDWTLGHLRRTGQLINKYPNAKAEAKRNTFFEMFAAYIQERLGDGAKSRLAIEVDLINRVEVGYRAILTNLDHSEITNRPPADRVAAYIARTLTQCALVAAEVKKALVQNQGVEPQPRFLLETQENEKYCPDTAVGTFVEILSMTLHMEAYKNNWFDAADCIALPELPNVAPEDLYIAGANEVWAQFWRRWERTEERYRYLGGKLNQVVAPNLPRWCPASTDELLVYTPPEDMFYEYASNDRLAGYLSQSFMDMMMETNIATKKTGIRNGSRLIPASFVSEMEAHAAVALSENLGYSISSDQDRPGGLRLVELLRGYAVIQELAEEHRSVNLSAPDRLLTITQCELSKILERCGLNTQAANDFIVRATFKRRSRDLFDCPLIKIPHDSLLLVTPAASGSNLAAIVLSAVSALGEPLSKKGKAFEKNMLGFFRENGLKAEAFTFKRGDQEYEYDVVVDWDDYLFVFECKNYSLSNNHPIRAYHFDLGMRANCRQVNRLAEALQQYPEVVRERFDCDVATKKVIPCLLYSLPYARFGRTNGVFVIDSSTIRRFFKERYVHVSVVYGINENAKICKRHAIKSLWTGDQPTPTDLMRQMDEPFPLKMTRAHTTVTDVVFALNAQTAVLTRELVRKEHTIESMCEAGEASSQRMREEMEKDDATVKVLRERGKAK